MGIHAATVYTKVTGVPTNGWESGTYIIVYEKSATKAIVWDATGDDNNFVEATISNGTITSESLKSYHTTVEKENKGYHIRTSAGRIGCSAKKDELFINGNGSICEITSEGGFTKVTTNTNTCELLCNAKSETSFRFRFFYNNSITQRKNVCFYALGEIEQGETSGVLDINYAQADLYACDSKFPAHGDQNNQYFYTNLRLMQTESNTATPYVDLEIYAPNQYSIAGNYKNSVNGATTTSPIKYWINCEAKSKHSTFFFKTSNGGRTSASIKTITLNISKVGESAKPNAYKYHIQMTLTDSNDKTWTLDKDLDVYAQWIDCDRSNNQNFDMDPVPFVLESGNHGGGTTAVEDVQGDKVQCTKVLRDGQLYLMYKGRMYDIQGQEVQL